jgi:serine/threonine protein kinase
VAPVPERTFSKLVTSDWQRLEGAVLAGQYTLQEWLGESENAAFFRTAHGSEARPAVLKLISADTVQPRAQLALWHRAAALSHPNLLALFDSGQTECGFAQVLFTVFEFPDETLQTALDQGPLTAPEALEILRAVVAGLSYVHSQGLVHSAVDARHLVAVGNQIKLSSDTLQPPTLSETVTDDLGSLGALLVHILTGRTLASAILADLPALPEPFRSIVLNTVQQPPARRWTLSDISQAIDPQPVAIGLWPTEEHETRQGMGFDPAPRASQWLAPRSPFVPRTFPLWAYAALAAMLVGLGFLFFPKSVPSVERPGFEPPESAKPTPVLVPVAPTVHAPPRPSPFLPPIQVAPAPQARDVWRLVAYTYSRYEDAERKAQTINRRWPEAKATVFAPDIENRPPFLVVLGGAMSSEEAVGLMKTARTKGLPRDTYIQNYVR